MFAIEETPVDLVRPVGSGPVLHLINISGVASQAPRLQCSDNSLFIKPTEAATRLAPDLPGRPPYPGAKDYPVADELLDDGDELRRLVIATADVLPAPKPKPKKVAKKKAAKP